MNDSQALKEARNGLLKLHKMLLDHERFAYEKQHGLLGPTEFLQVLLDDVDFAWLRKFSILIVEIDEMFADKGGYSEDLVSANLRKTSDLLNLRMFDEGFVAKYSEALSVNPEAASLSEEIKHTIAGTASLA